MLKVHQAMEDMYELIALGATTYLAAQSLLPNNTSNGQKPRVSVSTDLKTSALICRIHFSTGYVGLEKISRLIKCPLCGYRV